MNDEIEPSTYQTFKKFKEEKARLEVDLNLEKPQVKNSDDLVERLLPNLSKIHEIYEKGNIFQKQTLVKGGQR